MLKSSLLNPQRCAATALFLLFCLVGWWLALKKPLWNDEIYTQIQLDKYSNLTILQGQIPEGSNAPLFYILQNIITDAVPYHFPSELNREWYVVDFRGQQIMRLQPVVCMALMLTLIYYHFAINSSILAGLYALGVSLSSMMVWLYWAEARPYTLWMLLSASQLLLFLSIVRDSSIQRNWQMLVLVHWLLSLTVIVSLLQIVIASAGLWYFSSGRKNWKFYVFLALLPALTALYYYFKAPIFWYHLVEPARLFFDNISSAQIILLALWMVFSLRGTVEDEQKHVVLSRAFLGMLLSLLLASVLMLVIIACKSVPGAREVSSRMLIHLTPFGIVGTVLASQYFWNKSKNFFWIRFLLGVVFAGGFVVLHGLVVLQEMLNSTVY